MALIFEVELERNKETYTICVKAENAKKARLIAKNTKMGKVLGVKVSENADIADKNGEEISCSTKKALMPQHSDGCQYSITPIISSEM